MYVCDVKSRIYGYQVFEKNYITLNFTGMGAKVLSRNLNKIKRSNQTYETLYSGLLNRSEIKNIAYC